MSPSRRVLIIEDDADNLDLVSFLVQRAGHQVFRASNGPDGINLAREYLPDLVLLDISMPDMSGWEVAQILRDEPATAQIRLVALSAYALPAHRRRAREAGLDGYITKPIDIATFSTELDHFMDGSALEVPGE